MYPDYTGCNSKQTQPIKNMSSLTLVNENGLSETQLAQAKQLCEKHREIAELAKEVQFTEGRLKEKYVGLCNEIRKSGMNAKEFTLILRAQGFYASRVSEIKKVCALPQEVFDKYLAGDIGRKMAIKIARSGEDNVDEASSVVEQAAAADDQGNETDTTATPAVQPIVDPILPKLAKMLKMHKLAPGKHTALIEIQDYAVQILFTVKGKN